MNNYLLESRNDYTQDFDEILYLLKDSLGKLKQFQKDCKKNYKNIALATREDVTFSAQQFILGITNHLKIVSNMKRYVMRNASTRDLLERAETIKHASYEFIRTHQTRYAALITSTDWQSPSFSHALHSQAGRETGTIYATINDYKRDQHWDAYTYEQMFLKQYIDAFIKFPIHVLTTSSGMSALTTILDFLLLEKKVVRPILMGTSSYFQGRLLTEPMFSPNIIKVDESNTPELLQSIRFHNPSVIFIDSLTNSADILFPNLKEIIEYLVKHASQDTYLIIDNTGLSVDFQPIRMLLGKRSKLRIIVFESLMKFHQFGGDRVTGGIIYGFGGNDMGKLFNFRRHAGTNIPDVLAVALPTPNRKLLARRLLRHQRNATILATSLQTWIDNNPSSSFEKIVFPKLPNHPSYAWTAPDTFTGTYFAIRCKKKYQTIAFYKSFLARVINVAKSQGVEVVAGSSFGFSQTRIYMTSLHSKPSMPFIRVSVGTESRIIIETLVSVFISAFTLS